MRSYVLSEDLISVTADSHEAHIDKVYRLVESSLDKLGATEACVIATRARSAVVLTDKNTFLEVTFSSGPELVFESVKPLPIRVYRTGRSGVLSESQASEVVDRFLQGDAKGALKTVSRFRSKVEP